MKGVVYTCITGGYDSLLQPAPSPLLDSFDFICFTGTANSKADGPEGSAAGGSPAESRFAEARHASTGPWRLLELDPQSLPEEALRSNSLLSRYPKLQPHKLLGGYDFSLWVDGNIELLDDSLLKAALECAGRGVKYAGVPHPSRSDIFQEARMCHKMKLIDLRTLLRVDLRCFMRGIRGGSGLLENNIIFRRHNDPDIIALDNLWWDSILHLAPRDQLSLMLCLRRCGVRPEFLLGEGMNSRNHPGLKYLRHK